MLDAKLVSAGITKRGKFIDGIPNNYHIDMTKISDGKDPCIPVLKIDDDGSVYLRGEYNEELTAECRSSLLKVF